MYGYVPRFIPRGTEGELINLFHLARIALSGSPDRSKYHRRLWAAKEFAKKYDISSTGAYKDLDGLTN